MKQKSIEQIKGSDIISKFKHISWRWEEDNTITLCRLKNNFNSEIFRLNKQASLVFYYCDGRCTYEDIIRNIKSRLGMVDLIALHKFVHNLIKKTILQKGRAADILPVGGQKPLVDAYNEGFQIIDFFTEFNKHKKKGKLLRFRKPVRVLFTLNYSCNLSCKGCVQNYFNTHNGFRKTSISKDRALKIIDKLAEEKFLFISFMGGEIFLREDIYEIFQHCKDCGMLVMAITNATLLNEKKISQLARIGVNGFNIGFDSMKSSINQYSKDSTLHTQLIANILSINKRKDDFDLHIVCAINKKNCADIFRMYQFCLRNNIPNLCFFYHMPSHKPDKSIDMDVLTSIKSHIFLFLVGIINKYTYHSRINIAQQTYGWCHFKSSQMAINPEGMCDFCGMFNYTFGSLENNSVENIWNSKKMLEIVNYKNYAFPCSNCPSLERCAGFCRGVSFNVTGNPLGSVYKYCLSGRILVALNKIGLVKPRRVKVSSDPKNIVWFD